MNKDDTNGINVAEEQLVFQDDGGITTDGAKVELKDEEDYSENEEQVAEPADSESGADDGKNAAGKVDANELVGGERDEEEIIVTDIGTCGDFLVEGFAVETNIKRVNRLIKIPEKVIAYVIAALYFAVGVLCAVIPEKIEIVLPYIVGGAMGVGSLIKFIYALVKKEYKNPHSNKTASSLIMLGLSVMIIIEHEWAHTFIPMVWGIIGLCEAAHAFNLALLHMSQGRRCAYHIVKGLVELAVAFLLLYRPEQFGELHIIVFGVSLMMDAVVALPFVKKWVEG